MSLNWKPSTSTNDAIPERDLKLCALCGSLNYKDNQECFTCSWHGAFDRDEATIHYAWLRLYDECESVCLEHVSRKKTVSIGDFGVIAPTSRVQRTKAKIKAWWKEVMRKRDLRAGERENSLKKPQRFIA
jgi:hypothetical protein